MFSSVLSTSYSFAKIKKTNINIHICQLYVWQCCCDLPIFDKPMTDTVPRIGKVVFWVILVLAKLGQGWNQGIKIVLDLLELKFAMSKPELKTW